jgi:protein-S-isoprenylcysteine O-methyltransferase Ste14
MNGQSRRTRTSAALASAQLAAGIWLVTLALIRAPTYLILLLVALGLALGSISIWRRRRLSSEVKAFPSDQGNRI